MPTKELRCISDGFVQVRDENARLLGVCKMPVPSGDIVTTISGEVFITGVLMMVGIMCRSDQNPANLPEFEAYENAPNLVAERERDANLSKDQILGGSLGS